MATCEPRGAIAPCGSRNLQHEEAERLAYRKEQEKYYKAPSSDADADDDAPPTAPPADETTRDASPPADAA